VDITKRYTKEDAQEEGATARSSKIIIEIGGQTVLDKGTHYVFPLRHGVFRKAGSFFWENKYSKGDLSRRGIGLNKELYGFVMRTHKPFVVFDAENQTYLLFQDKELADKYHGKKTEKGTELTVIPIDCFKRIDYSEEMFNKDWWK